MNHPEPQDVTAALHEMPAWADVLAGDTGALASTEAAVRCIGGGDSDSVLSGIRRFIDERRETDDGFNVSAMSKLFVLNRYLFDVPEFVPLNQPGFGAFVGVPVHEGLVNELWPWEVDSLGELRLTGFFRGYCGETFLALEEADAFRSRYGPRNRMGCTGGA